jgi:23S rRNA (cytidine1920-2'-O)/16S rRNA (cytidine1409-2'-O)-methyltransferase
MPPESSKPKPLLRSRLDVALVQRGLAESRSQAQRLIMAGQVRLDGEVMLRPSKEVPATAAIAVDAGPRFVSRGGEKIEAALETFGLSVQGKVCADVGASTGGFTDCLLQRGARRVYAIDVGRGILHWKLRNDPRVVLLEGTNARHLERLPEPIDLVSIDAAFISLALLLPPAAGWLAPGGDVVALVKPQFEAGREAVGRGGVVRDSRIHREVLERVATEAAHAGLGPQAILRSPLLGPRGNVEFLLWAVKGGEARSLEGDIDRAVELSAIGHQQSARAKAKPDA